MNYSTAEIWIIIGLMAVGTYLIRFSFLGLIGNRALPRPVLRMLRYTAVGVLPGMVAPLVLWPEATGGDPDPVRLAAALATLAAGVALRSLYAAIGAGASVLAIGLWVAG